MKILARRFSAVSVAVLFVALATTPTPRLQAQSTTASASTTSAQVVDQLLSKSSERTMRRSTAPLASSLHFAVEPTKAQTIPEGLAMRRMAQARPN